jgi:predicted permease
MAVSPANSMRNITLAFRTLRKTPFVTAIAILSLALGIGANAAIFSLFDEMLLRPLPVAEPVRLVNLAAPGPKPGSQSCGQAGDCDDVFSYAMFRDLEKAPNTGFSNLAAHVLFGANIAFERQTQNGEGVLVSGSYFRTLGLNPFMGRLLTPQDDQTIGGHFVTVLSYNYWRNTLGGRSDVVGKSIVVNGHNLTIVGIAPAGFDGTTLGARPRVYVPLTMRAQMQPGWTNWERRTAYWAYVFGRLAPGRTIDEATRQINQVYRGIVVDVEAPLQEGMSAATMERFKKKELTLEPGQRGQSSVHREAKTPLLLLFAITGIVLLIACANIANLLLARAATRATEMAVRLSVGAGRGQLVRQLLTESVMLAVLGGLASVLVAFWTIKGITALLPDDAATSMNLELRPSALVFTGAVSLLTGLLFGLFPALQSTRPDLVTSLRSATGKHSGSRAAARFRSSLVTAQIALSMALLVSAGLFIKSLRNVSRAELGVKVDNVVTFGLSPRLNGYDNPRSAQLFERVERELAAIPGVTGVTNSLVPLLAGSNWGSDVAVQGFKKDPDTDANSRFNEVGPGYFRTLGIPLLAGREFTDADVVGSTKVAVVNEAFARKFGLGREAVGKMMGNGRGDSLVVQIVGLAKNAKYSDVKDEVPPLFFYPVRQDSAVGSVNFYVRTSLAPEQLLRTIPNVVRNIDANLPLEELKTMPQQIRENTFMERMISVLTSSFAVLATLLAAVGLYGVLAYTAAQRTREIGVRMALGADAGKVRRLVMRQVGLLTAVGGTIGIVGALGLGYGARSLLYQLQGHDPMVFILATIVLVAVAMGAGYLPALKASKTDPMQALRYE